MAVEEVVVEVATAETLVVVDEYDEQVIVQELSSPNIIEVMAGSQGVPGPPPVLNFSPVVTGAAGTNASLSTSGDNLSGYTLALTIPRGNTGATGPAPNLATGTVTSGTPGAAPTASISGTNPNYLVNFTLPIQNWGIGTVTTVAVGGSATASIGGTALAPLLNIGIPTGATGATGPAPTLNQPTVTSLSPVSTPTATFSGTNPYTLQLGLPAAPQILSGATAPAAGTGQQGFWYINTATWDMSEKTSSTVWTTRLNIRGATGPAPTFNSAVSVTTGAAGSAASASISGTNPYTLNLTIPRGDTGAIPTINSTINVTTGAAGTSASASWSGTNPYTLNITVPRGDPGTGNVTSQGALTVGNLASWNTTGGFIQDAGFAASDVARKSTTNTFTLAQTFSVAPVVPDASFTISKTNGLQTALDGKAALVHGHALTDANITGILPDAQLPTRLGTINKTQTVFNNITENGWHKLYTVDGSVANAPTTDAGDWMIFVEAYSPTYVVQTAHLLAASSGTATKRYRRSQINGVWQAWYQISDSKAEQDARYVMLTGNQTIAGSKQFTSGLTASQFNTDTSAGYSASFGANAIAFSRNSANYIQTNSAGGYVRFAGTTTTPGDTIIAQFNTGSAQFTVPVYVGSYTGAATVGSGGASASFVPKISASETSGQAGIEVYVADGTNNRRAALIVNQTDGVWGLVSSYTSGNAPFILNLGGVELMRVDPNSTPLISLKANTAVTGMLSSTAGFSATTGTFSSTISATGATLSGLTASRVVTTSTGGLLAVSTVTTTELGYLSGVTSAVQTQLNAKEGTLAAGTTAQYYRGDKTWQTLNVAAVSGAAPLASPTFTGTVTATTFSGSGASLTSIPSSSLTGTINPARFNTDVMIDRGIFNFGVNWNAITTAGTYNIAYADISVNSNYPVGAYGYGTMVVAFSGTAVTQTYYPHNFSANRPVYWRSRYNASDWGAWQTLNDVSLNDARYVTLSGDQTISGTKTFANVAIGSTDLSTNLDRSIRVETDQRGNTLTYTDGLLTSVTEKSGATDVRVTNMTYTDGLLTQTVEYCAGKTITTTFTYTDGVLTGTSKVVS